MVFTGGPCTTGPGAVVGLALEDSIRTHRVTHCSWQTIRRECSLDHSCMQSCLIHVVCVLAWRPSLERLVWCCHLYPYLNPAQ